MTIYKNKKTGAEIKAYMTSEADGVNKGYQYKKRTKSGDWSRGSWWMSVEALEEKWEVVR